MGAIFRRGKNEASLRQEAWVQIHGALSIAGKIDFEAVRRLFDFSQPLRVNFVFEHEIKSENPRPHFLIVIVRPEKNFRRSLFLYRPEFLDKATGDRRKIFAAAQEHAHDENLFTKVFANSHSDCLPLDFIAYFNAMKTRILAFLMVFAVLFTVAAEGNGTDELVTIFNKSPLEFDPHKSIYSNEAQIFTALYEGLFSYDPSTLDPVPSVASSWTRSSDGKTYTFALRESARWSDGSRVVSQDFRNSWLRMLALNEDYATFFDIIEGAHDFRLGITKDPASVGIETPDGRTLVVRLIRPAAYFTRLLCHHSFAPIHPSMLNESSWTSRIPFPVNGPYRFASYDGETLRLEKNPYYWDAASVAIPTLSMLFTDDDSQASQLFNDDEAQWLAGPGDYKAILLQEAIQINPIFATHYWYFNCKEAPWSDARIRLALALLVPWSSVRSNEYYAVSAETLVLPLPGYSEAKGIAAQDKDKAMQLLTEAGFPDGQGLPDIQIYYADGVDPLRIATAFKNAWETALPSLKVRIAPLRSAQYYELIQDGKVDFTLAHTTWIGDFADPEAFLQMWASDSSLNDSGYRSDSFSAMLEKSYSKDGKERMSLLAKAETILLQDAAALPIYHGLAASVIDTDLVNGWYQNALDIHPYKYLKFGTPHTQPNIAWGIPSHNASSSN